MKKKWVGWNARDKGHKDEDHTQYILLTCCPGAWKADSWWLFGVQSPLCLFLALHFLLLKYSQRDSAQEMCRISRENSCKVLPFFGSSFSCHCCSVAELCLTLWDPTACSTLDFPVLNYLPEFAQTLVHWVGDAIQPSYPLPLPFPPPALNLSQHRFFFLIKFKMILLPHRETQFSFHPYVVYRSILLDFVKIMYVH